MEKPKAGQTVRRQRANHPRSAVRAPRWAGGGGVSQPRNWDDRNRVDCEKSSHSRLLESQMPENFVRWADG